MISLKQLDATADASYHTKLVGQDPLSYKRKVLGGDIARADRKSVV